MQLFDETTLETILSKVDSATGELLDLLPCVEVEEIEEELIDLLPE